MSAGRFWWRGRSCGRKAACDPGLGSCLVPFPIFNALVAAEAAVMLCILWGRGVFWPICRSEQHNHCTCQVLFVHELLSLGLDVAVGSAPEVNHAKSSRRSRTCSHRS